MYWTQDSKIQLKANSVDGEVISLKQKFDIFWSLLKPERALLVSGNSGLGKTHNVRELCKRQDCTFNFAHQPMREEFNEDKMNVLFYEEAHRLSKKEQNLLLIKIDEGMVRHAMTINNEIVESKFRIAYIFATSNPEKLLEPLKNRCFEINLDFWSDEIIASAITDTFPELKKIATDIASVSKGAIRPGMKIAETVMKVGSLDLALSLLNIDNLGLTQKDRRYLTTLYNGSIISLAGLASTIGTSKEDVEEAIEPYLRRKGWIEVVPGGRRITHLGRSVVESMMRGSS